MQGFYHHHVLDDLGGYQYRLLYDPRSLMNRLSKNPHPFPWICVYK
jgi:hypothetical protein